MKTRYHWTSPSTHGSYLTEHKEYFERAQSKSAFQAFLSLDLRMYGYYEAIRIKMLVPRIGKPGNKKDILVVYQVPGSVLKT